MKTNFKVIIMALFVSVALASVFNVTQPVAAAEKDSERIMFSEPVMVAGTLLKPGLYKIAWEGAGPEVQVRFIKDTKTVVTTSARIVFQANPYDGSLGMKTSSDNSKVLQSITWKKKALIFDATN
jgi:hypothetical protein